MALSQVAYSMWETHVSIHRSGSRQADRFIGWSCHVRRFDVSNNRSVHQNYRPVDIGFVTVHRKTEANGDKGISLLAGLSSTVPSRLLCRVSAFTSGARVNNRLRALWVLAMFLLQHLSGLGVARLRRNQLFVLLRNQQPDCCRGLGEASIYICSLPLSNASSVSSATRFASPLTR